ncbi:hypothetical protein PIB30_089964 [Stylosanthes scabra]|uniref:Uncharacterized protein n=1 Tax=Stylosanthes scabra TaxID=79078 RepID=A0ABU6RU32_9FABA|nr:hypothetical protein [Stylosanthes scabra]
MPAMPPPPPSLPPAPSQTAPPQHDEGTGSPQHEDDPDYTAEPSVWPSIIFAYLVVKENLFRKANHSLNLNRNNGATTKENTRSASTIRRLKMYKTRPVRERKAKILSHGLQSKDLVATHTQPDCRLLCQFPTFAIHRLFESTYRPFLSFLRSLSLPCYLATLPHLVLLLSQISNGTHAAYLIHLFPLSLALCASLPSPQPRHSPYCTSPSTSLTSNLNDFLRCYCQRAAYPSRCVNLRCVDHAYISRCHHCQTPHRRTRQSCQSSVATDLRLNLSLSPPNQTMSNPSSALPTSSFFRRAILLLSLFSVFTAL